MRRLAWFSPMPPARSGVAACSADLIGALRGACDIDVFVDASRRPPPPGTRSAHDFLWLNRQAPYDLVVYQLGNSAVHDYMWPYLFRYPGLAVLHDGHLHHARAATLLGARRFADYRAEFAANHPDANPDVAELAIAGFDSHLYYDWPMIRLVVERSRLTAVHAAPLAAQLAADFPQSPIETIRLGHGCLVHAEESQRMRSEIRARLGIPGEAVVFGCFGALTPDKRLPQILETFAAIRRHDGHARLLLAGAIPSHYDLRADIERWGVAGSTVLTGYLESDAELTAHVAACDVGLNLRWPTAREMSGPWLRCLAAAKPTVILALAHLVHVPALDPRTWLPNTLAPGMPPEEAAPPACVAIDLLDETHSLRLALRRLVEDGELRAALGRNGQEYWQAHHAPALMVEDYQRVIARACALAAPAGSGDRRLPSHLLKDGDEALQGVLRAFGLANPLR